MTNKLSANTHFFSWGTIIFLFFFVVASLGNQKHSFLLFLLFAGEFQILSGSTFGCICSVGHQMCLCIVLQWWFMTLVLIVLDMKVNATMFVFFSELLLEYYWRQSHLVWIGQCLWKPTPETKWMWMNCGCTEGPYMSVWVNSCYIRQDCHRGLRTHVYGYETVFVMIESQRRSQGGRSSFTSYGGRSAFTSHQNIKVKDTFVTDSTGSEVKSILSAWTVYNCYVELGPWYSVNSAQVCPVNSPNCVKRDLFSAK